MAIHQLWSPHGCGIVSEVVHLGPLALAADRLIAMAALWLFVIVGATRWFAGGQGGVTVTAATVGVIAARLAYVASHLASFADDPLSILALWDGGFVLWAGVAAAAAVIVWRLRSPNRLRELALLALVACNAFVFEPMTRITMPSPFAQTGIALHRLDGSVFDGAAAIRGRPAIVNLWADWCPPCRHEMPVLHDATRGEPTVAMFLVNQGDSPAKALSLPRATGFDAGAVVLDPTARLAKAYGGALPTTIFIDAAGRVRAVHSGAISRAQLMDNIAMIREPTA
jgi:hypothetical protein